MRAAFPPGLVVSDRSWRLDGAPGGGPQPGRIWAVALIPEGGRLILDGREAGAVLVPQGGTPIRAEWSGVRRMRELRLWPFAALDGPVPLDGLPAAEAPGGVTGEALRLLVAARGRIGVGVLARRLGCSERHLRGAMRARIGLGPSQAARLLRVEAAVRAIGATGVPLAAVAQDAGFADQAHMTRALRRHAGATPGDLRSVQDPAPETA